MKQYFPQKAVSRRFLMSLSFIFPNYLLVIDCCHPFSCRRKIGREFPSNFPSQIKLVYRLLLHVFAHIYHAHFQVVLHLKSEGHLNSLFAHFLAFGREFGLLDTKDLKGGVPSSSAAGNGPVAIGDLYDKWKELGILEGQ
jgi:MOB kinase activator 1